MPGKPITYVRRVTNLSDARYCAGMGVDMLGYVIDPDDADYVSPKLYQEMSGWVAGPRRVIELTSSVDAVAIIEQYNPELVHVHFNKIQKTNLPDLPLILECDFAACERALREGSTMGLRTEYLLITGLKGQAFNTDFHPLLIDLGAMTTSGLVMVQQYDADGIAMTGTREQAPGLKDYDHLAQVLEEIDRM
jgi:phosphoribosylanthranilate isomerase